MNFTEFTGFSIYFVSHEKFLFHFRFAKNRKDRKEGINDKKTIMRIPTTLFVQILISLFIA
jgi:hypothetical protein